MYFSNPTFYDAKDLKVHYDGVWAPAPPDGLYTVQHYEFGFDVVLEDVDGDTIMLLDLIEGICNTVPTLDQSTSLGLSWIDSGIRRMINNDRDLLNMWSSIEVESDGYIHIFAEVITAVAMEMHGIGENLADGGVNEVVNEGNLIDDGDGFVNEENLADDGGIHEEANNAGVHVNGENLEDAMVNGNRHGAKDVEGMTASSDSSSDDDDVLQHYDENAVQENMHNEIGGDDEIEEVSEAIHHIATQQSQVLPRSSPRVKKKACRPSPTKLSKPTTKSTTMSKPSMTMSMPKPSTTRSKPSPAKSKPTITRSKPIETMSRPATRASTRRTLFHDEFLQEDSDVQNNNEAGERRGEEVERQKGKEVRRRKGKQVASNKGKGKSSQARVPKKGKKRRAKGQGQNEIGGGHFIVDSDIESIPDSDDNVPKPKKAQAEISDPEDDDGVPCGFDNLDPRDHYVAGYTTDEDAINEFIHSTTDCYEDEEHDFGLYQELPKADTLYQGMEWPTIPKACAYMKRHAIFHHYRIKYQKNYPTRLRAQCADVDCEWFCNITQMKDGYKARCKKLGPDHTCYNDVEFGNHHDDARWVALVIEPKFRANPTWRSAHIIDEIWWSHTVKISYWVAWNAKRMVQRKIYGTLEDGYRLSPVICEQVLRTNPGSIATCSRDNSDGGFYHLCLAFKASLDGFVAGCRPLIGLDGCHLTTKYGGICLSAVALDGNNGLFPIAIYICRNENKESWLHFLGIIKDHLELHPQRLTFMLDRQKVSSKLLQHIFLIQHIDIAWYTYTETSRSISKGIILRGLLGELPNLSLHSCTKHTWTSYKWSALKLGII